MSADNFIAVIKKGRGYTGYHCSASHNYPYVKCFDCIGKKCFTTTGLRHAVNLAQAENTEYGYFIYDWEKEPEFPAGCPCETRMFISINTTNY